MYSKASWYTDFTYAVRAKKIVFKAVGNEDVKGKLIWKLMDQLAISIFIHHSLTDDLFGSIRIPEKEKEMYSKASRYTDSRYAVWAQKIVCKAVVNKDANSKLISRINLQLTSSFTIALQTICLTHSAYL